MHKKHIKTKRTFRKNIVREITKSLSRFMAILAIVALGVGFLAGLMATTPDMRFSADKYYDDTNTMDIKVISTLGLTDDDLEAISGIEGIKSAIPAYSADMLLFGNDHDSIVTKIHSIPPDNPEYQNQVILVEGRMPEKAGECVIEQKNILSAHINIGDRLEVTDENIDPEDKLDVKGFEIVGIVKSAQYFSIERERSNIGNGTIGLIMYTPEESFSFDVYTEIYATVVGALELEAFADEYDDLVGSAMDDIELISENQISLRYNNIMDDANKELNDAKNEYNDKKAEAEKELQDALDKINDGKQEIADAEIEIADGFAKLNNAQSELDKQRLDFNSQIADKQKEIEDGRVQIAAAKDELAISKAELDIAAVQIEQIRPLAPTNPQIAEQVAIYDASVSQYNQALEEINRKEAELTQAEKLLNDGISGANEEFKTVEKELADNRKKLADAQSELATAKTDLENGIKEYNDAKKETDEKLSDAEKKLDDAQKEINKLKRPEWYILDRHSNAGFESFLSNAQKVEAIAKVFPIFFFLVAALVALTTMTRMIEEERTQIGTLKSLGYSNSTIASKYLIYAGAASIIGSIAGLLVGFKLFPTVIWNAYEMMYTLPPLITQFNVKYALLSSLTAIACTIGATLAACYSTLKECPARLMLPRAPKAGKRVFLEYITPVWKRMKFTHKVTARNLIRYKKRFFMTVIGVAGCTALLLTGFGLRDSIGDIINKQFSEIFKYNLIVNTKDENDMRSSEALKSILSNKDNITDYTAIHQENAKASGTENKRKVETIVTVIEDETRLKDFILLQDRKTRTPIDFNENTVIVTEKLSERLELGIGDKITLELNDNKTAKFTISAITENYVTGYVYIPHQLYEDAYGERPEYNMIIGNVPNADEEHRDNISTELLKDDNVNAVSFTDVIKSEFDNLLKNIDYIVIVLIISAGLLAFIVLYNLTNINITERQKEIATIKVLGFFDYEVSGYVFRETIILSFIGTLAGLVFGIFLHAFVVKTAEVDAVMFGRSIYPLSYVISAALTMVFSLLVNLVMKKKLKKIDMVESMKANE